MQSSYYLHPVAKVLIRILPPTNFFDFASKKPKYQLCQDELCTQHEGREKFRVIFVFCLLLSESAL